MRKRPIVVFKPRPSLGEAALKQAYTTVTERLAASKSTDEAIALTDELIKLMQTESVFLSSQPCEKVAEE